MAVYPKAGEYPMPRKNVLVISCMDLRLTDNLVDFLQADNLTNRYDHFILAGASLFASVQELYPLEKGQQFLEPWKKCLNDHLEAAIYLHSIKDVYIVEHEDCGAYANFLKEGKFDDRQKEETCHQVFATALAREINEKVHYETDKAGDEFKYQIGVHCFFIDLRGDVKHLKTIPGKYEQSTAERSGV